MNTKALSCPNCGAALEVEDGLDTFFCKYCGYKIILEGQSDAAYRAKTKIKSMEHDERMADKKYEHERYKIEEKKKAERFDTKITMVIIGALVLFLVIYFVSAKIESDKQERELQKLVEEIEEYIEDGDFDKAYVKAQSIKHTAAWSSEIEDKWDETRKEVINQIIEAEKEETGKSNHKPEKDGFFDGWFDW